MRSGSGVRGRAAPRQATTASARGRRSRPSRRQADGRRGRRAGSAAPASTRSTRRAAVHVAPPVPGRRRSRWSPSAAGRQRHVELDRGALARALESRRCPPRAARRSRIEVWPRWPGKAARGIEADAVVADLQAQPLASSQARTCTRVARACLTTLCSASCTTRSSTCLREGEVGLVGQVALGREAVAQLEAVELAVQRADEADVDEGLGAQLEDQRPHLGQRRLGQLHHGVERLARLVGIALGVRRWAAWGQHDGVDRLADRVVQLAGQVAPRLVGGLVAGALVEAHVLDRDRRLGGDAARPAEPLVVPARAAAPGRAARRRCGRAPAAAASGGRRRRVGSSPPGRGAGPRRRRSRRRAPPAASSRRRGRAPTPRRRPSPPASSRRSSTAASSGCSSVVTAMVLERSSSARSSAVRAATRASRPVLRLGQGVGHGVERLASSPSSERSRTGRRTRGRRRPGRGWRR
jgi:hypothetical protein